MKASFLLVHGEAPFQSVLWLAAGWAKVGRVFAQLDRAVVMTLGLQSLSSYVTIRHESNAIECLSHLKGSLCSEVDFQIP